MYLSKTNPAAQQKAREISGIARVLWQKGWAEGTAGNISLDVTEYYPGITLDFRTFPLIPLKKAYPDLAGHFLFVTRKSSRMREVADDPANNLCLVKFNKAGNAYQLLFEDLDHPNEPTSELFTHFGIQEMFPLKGKGEKAVLHAHATELIALSHIKEFQDEERLNDLLLRMHTETAFFIPDGIGFIPFEVPGSKELADKTLKSLQNHEVVLWEKHGCLCIGQSVSDAFDKIDMLSKAARLWLIGQNAGYDPQGLNKDQMKKLKALYDNIEF